MRAVIFTLVLTPGIAAETVRGTILVRKKLTRSHVETPVSLYERGMAPTARENTARGAGEANVDPLDYERSRVVVWLEGTGPLAPADSVPAILRQTGRRFVPDLLVIVAGSGVAFPNLDPIFHNVFSLSKPKTFDLGNYDKGESRSVTFPKPGVAYVNCHLHPNMSATIVVTPNRWNARVEPNGHYSIPDVPPGEYTAVAWHKACGVTRKAVRVEPGRGAVLDFFVPVGENEAVHRAYSAPVHKEH